MPHHQRAGDRHGNAAGETSRSAFAIGDFFFAVGDFPAIDGIDFRAASSALARGRAGGLTLPARIRLTPASMAVEMAERRSQCRDMCIEARIAAAGERE